MNELIKFENETKFNQPDLNFKTSYIEPVLQPTERAKTLNI